MQSKQVPLSAFRGEENHRRLSDDATVTIANDTSQGRRAVRDGDNNVADIDAGGRMKRPVSVIAIGKNDRLHHKRKDRREIQKVIPVLQTSKNEVAARGC